jgi:hypothetical protein
MVPLRIILSSAATREASVDARGLTGSKLGAGVRGASNEDGRGWNAVVAADW